MFVVSQVGEVIKIRIKKNTKPLSQIVKKKISEYIKEQEISIDDKLPSESELVEMMGVSRVTIREALAQLEQQGIVYKIQGKGTFLKRVPVEMENGLEVLYSPTELMNKFGYNPKTVYLPTKIGEPDSIIKEKLNLDSNDKVVTYRRKRFADGELAVYGVDSVPVDYFPDEVPDRLPRESMLNFLEEDLNLRIEFARTEIIPIIFDDKMANFLEVKQDTIFLLLNQIHINNSGKPVVYSLDYFNSDVFKFIINRKRIR